MKPPKTAPVLAAALILLAAACSHTQTAPRPALSEKGYDGPVLVSANERTLTVGGYPHPCDGAVAAVESLDAVRIYLLDQAPCPRTPTYPAAEIALKAPLSGRALLNGATGRRLEWFNERHLIHPVLPSGYTTMEEDALIPYAYDRTRKQVSGAEQLWSDGHGTILTLVQTSSADLRQLPVPCPEALGRHLTVRGSDGIGCPGSVIWLENGMACEITTEYSTHEPTPMAADRLVDIADSAPPAG